MKPAPFTYHRPGSLDAALALMARFGAEAKPLGGGQSLGPMLNMRVARPSHLIDLNDLLELDYIRTSGEMIEIGAMTRHHRLATGGELDHGLPVLAAAARTIGHYAIRQRGTIGGSLVHADPAAQLPLLAVTLGARVVLRSARGTRELSASDFFQSIMTVDLEPDEIAIAVQFPRLAVDEGWGFELFSRRHGDFAIASICATVRLDEGGRITALRLGIGGVAAVPLLMGSVEVAAVGVRLDAEGMRDLASEAAQSIDPENSREVSADFRRDLVETLIARALRSAVARTGTST